MKSKLYSLTGFGLKCFECDNKINPACGVYFKSYQFMPPSECWGYVKCGLQRQQPLKDDTQQPYSGICCIVSYVLSYAV